MAWRPWNLPGWMGGEFTDTGWHSLSTPQLLFVQSFDPATAMLVLCLATQSSVMPTWHVCVGRTARL